MRRILLRRRPIFVKGQIVIVDVSVLGRTFGNGFQPRGVFVGIGRSIDAEER